jgi:hypothetical protein
MADNLPPSIADVMESGNLNLPEHSGPHRPVMGLIYMFNFICNTYDLLTTNLRIDRLYFLCETILPEGGNCQLLKCFGVTVL